MKEELLRLIEKFTGKPFDMRANPYISSSGMSSVMSDRFKSELRKLGINWDGSDVLYSDLIDVSQDVTSQQEKISVHNGKESFSKAPSVSDIGIDIQLITDFESAKDYWESEFYMSNFSEGEISYALKKANPLETLVGIYSLKEAIFKADNSHSRRSISILHKNGKPYFAGFEVSISHSGFIAVAVARKVEDASLRTKPSDNEIISNSAPANVETRIGQRISYINWTIIIVTQIILVIISLLLYNAYS